MKNYVIGLGTGRCGTVSLAKLLSGCKNTNVSHEFRERVDIHYRLSWEFNEREAERRVQNLKSISGNLVGDVAHYYLNYVDYFSSNLKNIHYIYLWRHLCQVIFQGV